MQCDNCGAYTTSNWATDIRAENTTLCKKCMEPRKEELSNSEPEQTGDESTFAANEREYKFCSECGKKISPKAAICPFCGVATGNPMPSQKTEEPIKSGVLVAGYLLAFLFPLLGLLIGVYTLFKNAVGHGIVIAGLSLTFMVFWWNVGFMASV